ncbi:hypothetical protein AVEN_212239-1 [Araneus ventricosus]|uniref:Uncharacterized protein n=1 Tax=Araneus ventricosus TaxID=182803 RepID=A0A4Y2EMF4_ARAVE|nr:hypothetical protein AVEN_212239-1 [Araneus ventricosus]
MLSQIKTKVTSSKYNSDRLSVKRAISILLEDFLIVTNMESHFPAMIVLCLGREFYKGMYGNSGGMEPSTLDLGDKFGDFGDEMWDLKSTGIFLKSLLKPRSGFLQMIPCDVTPCRGDYKITVFG